MKNVMMRKKRSKRRLRNRMINEMLIKMLTKTCLLWKKMKIKKKSLTLTMSELYVCTLMHIL